MEELINIKDVFALFDSYEPRLALNIPEMKRDIDALPKYHIPNNLERMAREPAKKAEGKK